MIAAQGIDPEGSMPGSSMVRTFVVVLSATLALVVIRGGAPLRRSVGLQDDVMEVRDGRHAVAIPYREFAEVVWVGAFSEGRSWVPTIAVRARSGLTAAVPGALRDGEEFVARLLELVGDETVTTWAEARDLRGRPRWARAGVAVGYAVAVGLLFGTAAWVGR